MGYVRSVEADLDGRTVLRVRFADRLSPPAQIVHADDVTRLDREKPPPLG